MEVIELTQAQLEGVVAEAVGVYRHENIMKGGREGTGVRSPSRLASNYCDMLFSTSRHVKTREVSDE